MKKKNKKLINKASIIILPVAVTIFLITLFSVFWNWLRTNSSMVLIATGAIILLFILLGTFKWNKFKKGIRRKLR